MERNRNDEPLFHFHRWSHKSFGAFASLLRLKICVLSVGMSSILLLPQSLRGAEVDTVGICKVLDIDEISIEGNKSTPTRSAMLPTLVYDRKVEAAAPVQTLESALRLSPSIDIRERGGKGIQTDISIRGGSFDQTMILLNGINFTDARTGHQTHSLPVDMDCISGVEIIDGVTGVGAFAGAVNVRTAPLHPAYLRADLSGGAYGYGYANISGAATYKDFTLMAMGSGRRSDGYIHNTDFRNCNGYLRATWDSAIAGFFDVQAGYQSRGFGSNGFYSLAYKDQFEQTETALASLRWVRAFGPLTINAAGSYRKNLDRFELVRGKPDAVPFNYHDTDNAGAELWGDMRWVGGTTSLGGDYTYNHIYSTVLGHTLETPHGRYTHGDERHVGNLWLRHIKHWQRFDVSASAGISFSPYGNSALWSISGGYRAPFGLGIEVGAGQSMRLPTFTDLYYTAKGYVSNPDLKPERAVTYRLKAGYGSEHWSVGAFVYYRDADNIIDWVKTSAESDWMSQQITELGTFGAELSAGYVSSGWLRRVSLAYGYVHASKDSGGLISKYAFDYMRNKVAAGVEVHFLKRFALSLTGTLYDRTGSYADASGAVLNYKPYFLLDGRLSFEWRIVRLYIDAMNITDTRYFDYGGLRMPGIWLSGGVTVTIF